MSTPLSTETTMETPATTTTPMRFEVARLPVGDLDRAKAFYTALGWRVDIDFEPAPSVRAVQMTPPGSPASIQFASTPSKMEPGSLEGMILVVDDIAAARDELVANGVEVGEIFHTEPGKGPQPGLDPDRRSYFSRANFDDPDGNTWQMQEITERLPGRVGLADPSALADLLKETALHHGAFEAVAPPHDWWDWYAAYMDARERGIAPDEASAAADRFMAEVKGVVAQR
jgi:catechol 2,3-dioxygenase-like lactoylglutathione lyase family enzyme